MVTVLSVGQQLSSIVKGRESGPLMGMFRQWSLMVFNGCPLAFKCGFMKGFKIGHCLKGSFSFQGIQGCFDVTSMML